LVLTAQDALL